MTIASDAAILRSEVYGALSACQRATPEAVEAASRELEVELRKYSPAAQDLIRAFIEYAKFSAG